MSQASAPVLNRLWRYQSERFPLLRTGLLLAMFTAASINVSAQLGHRPAPGIFAYMTAFLVTLIFFFQLRICDEVKDADDDRRYRPERPVPRGLVSLRLIVRLGLCGVPLALTASLTQSPWLVLPLLLVWTWMALMTAEFFVPTWLKAQPLAYLVSHMLIMPLIDFFVTACEWLPVSRAPPPQLWLFLALSFANGCVLEIGRKLYAPANERAGVETYSSLLGVYPAALAWCAVLFLAYVLLVGIGLATGHPVALALVGAAALGVALACAVAYAKRPTATAQKRLDAVAGLWVLVCYGAAGFTPWVLGASS